MLYGFALDFVIDFSIGSFLLYRALFKLLALINKMSLYKMCPIFKKIDVYLMEGN